MALVNIPEPEESEEEEIVCSEESEEEEEKEIECSEESDLDSFINDDSETSVYSTEESEWEESETESEPEPKKRKQ